MTTQVNADWVPPRSAMIRGRTVQTTLVARMETNIPSRMPERASSTWRWVIATAGWAAAAALSFGRREDTVVMR